MLLIIDINSGSRTAANNPGLLVAGHLQWFRNHI
jgi:hypothetical protein